MFQHNKIINFSDLQFEITSRENLRRNIEKYISVKKQTKKISTYEYLESVLQVQLDDSDISVLFSKKIPIPEVWLNKSSEIEISYNSVNEIIKEHNLCKEKLLVSADRIIKTSISSSNDIPFYLSITYLSHNNDNTVIEFFLKIFDINDNEIGAIKVVPNSNILLPKSVVEESIGSGLKIGDISYFKISMNVKGKCKFNLNYFVFSFVDYLSSHIYYSKKFDATIRLQVNNLKKKKNGVVIFFPSFYIKERDTDSINKNDNSVKWPNFTRYTWSRDLENICTIFVADPFQFSNGNERSSWFIAPNGESIIPEIASYIKSILEIKEIHEPSNENSFSLLDIHDMPTPKNENFFSLFSINHKCGPIINYGSSMGGYAAFLFSCYLEPDLCFIECPQANILNYKFSFDYLAKRTRLKTRLNKVRIAISKLLEKDREKKKRYYFSKIAKTNDLSFSAIFQNYTPKFSTLIHFYSLDKQHLLSFNNEISLLSDNERKMFNYRLIIENDIENELFTHQAMPKDKVLEIFRSYLSKKNH